MDWKQIAHFLADAIALAAFLITIAGIALILAAL